MSKMIAVCGSPGSGKTTTALKVAQEIYYGKNGSVIFLSPDLNVPCMAYLFPHCKESELYSIGTALDKTDIYREDVMKQIVTVKTMRNFGFLGFKNGENRYSYPHPTEDKVLDLFRITREIADFVVVDCMSDPDDLISNMARADAETAVQVITPDLKCLAYYASQADQFTGIAERCIKVMNIQEKDLYLPTEEVKSHFKNVNIVLPYSHALKQQAITGTLSERIGDQKYRSAVSAVVKAVI